MDTLSRVSSSPRLARGRRDVESAHLLGRNTQSQNSFGDSLDQTDQLDEANASAPSTGSGGLAEPDIATDDSALGEESRFRGIGALPRSDSSVAVRGGAPANAAPVARRPVLIPVVGIALIFVALAAVVLKTRPTHTASAADMLRTVYTAEDPRAAAELLLRAAGETVPPLLLSASPSPTALPSLAASRSASQAPSSTPSTAAAGNQAEDSGRLGLTCQDAGDGDACNDPPPPDDVLLPHRLPDWGTSLCRKPVYPQPFEYLGMQRVTAHPFWSCDNVWEIADHHSLDWPSWECPMDTSRFRCGDTVFFHTAPERLTQWLQNEHKQIRWPYIIMSCNFDTPPPFPDAAQVLRQQPADSPKLWAWYGQNVGVLGPIPRAHSLPAGLPSGGWRSGDRERDGKVYYRDPMQAKAALRAKLVAFLDGSWQLNHTMQDTIFASFTISNNPGERQPAADAAARLGSGDRHISEDEYSAALKRALFVLAPGGVGLDVYRVTEAVVAGALPVLREHYWPIGYYDGWPRVLVGRWDDITHDWLRTAAEASLAMLDSGQFDFRRAYGAFQLARIRREQRRAREWCAARGDSVSASLVLNASLQAP